MASSAKMLKAVEVYAKRQTPNMTCEVRPTSAAAWDNDEVDTHRDIKRECGRLSQGYKGGVAGRGTCPRSGAGRKSFALHCSQTVHIYYIYTHSQSTYSILLYGFMKRERDNKDLISWEGSARRRVFCEADADARE